MERKFVTFIFILLSIICYSQNNDTIFIKREKGHNIYKIQDRNSNLYDDIYSFQEFENDSTYKISKIGLNSKWIKIHKYKNDYVLYAPCDWCNDSKYKIEDNFLQFRGCELVKYKIKSIKKISSKEFKIEYLELYPEKRKTYLLIKEVDSKLGIYEFSYLNGKDKSKTLFIKDSDYKKFDIINNECKFEKSSEIKFNE